MNTTNKKDAKKEALKKYNEKWAFGNETTRHLYNEAAKNPELGVKLQEHVLALLGSPDSKKMVGRKSAAAQAFIDWMISQRDA